ncbi:MAG TPA: hypothetical protein PK413_18575, partial [Thermoanaerobaculia bacterium]|nr:hypothetical protein [Thermoanaerobaculia bacterium]
GGLDSVRAAAAGRGLTGLGYHLDVDYGGNLASWAKTMAALRKKVDRRLYLSANLKRSSLGSSEAEDLASAADFLVVFLYGQRPPEREEATAWDLQKVEKDLRLVEKLGRPYLLGVVTLGRSFHLGPRGEVLAESSEIAVGPLARSSSFQLGRGFSLEGVDRLVYSFQAQEPVTVGPWRLSRGQSVRLIGLARYYIEELSRRLEALDLDHYRGTAYYRFAGANEPTSLSLDTLARALSSDSSKPQVGVTLEPAGGRRFRVTIENLSEERSDIAVLGSNFVEVEAAAGGVLSRVDPGEFQRWELLRKNSDGELVRDFRDATTLRLFTPILEPHERRTSGTFEVSGRAGTPTAHAKFLFPGGIAVEAQSQSSTGSP